MGATAFRIALCVVGTACLGATAPSPPATQLLEEPGQRVDAELGILGEQQYVRCVACHGPGVVATGTAPDLRTSPLSLAAVPFASIVRGGALANQGMPGFPELTNRELDGLRYYIRVRARETL